MKAWRGSRFDRAIGVAAVCGACIFARAAMALPTLIFIDDFSNNSLRVPSPAPGEGAGVIATNGNFWTGYNESDPAYGGHTQGAYVETNGYIRFDRIAPTKPTSPIRLISGTMYPEFNFMATAQGEGLLLEVRGLEMDWDADYLAGTLDIGFWTGGTISSTTNAFTVRIYGGPGVESGGHMRQFYLRGKQAGTWIYPGFISIVQDMNPVGFDLYLDSTEYRLTTYYDDGETTRELSGQHGFDAERFTVLGLHMIHEAAQSNSSTFAQMGSLSVTQIPEPGAMGLALAALGAAWLSRRIRRRGL